MGALTSPAGRHSWELLYRQPHPAWPDALTKVAVMGVLTQALLKIPEPEMTRRIRSYSGLSASLPASVKAPHLKMAPMFSFCPGKSPSQE
jgi:hypothetical protein